jgi:hypothetical protein
MPFVQLPCPHCGTEAVSFASRGSYRHPKLGTTRLFLVCGVCSEPVIAAYPSGAVEQWADGQIPVFPDVKQIWLLPKAIVPMAPNAVPTNIASLYVQAMSALQRSHYDAAGPLFRRIMEVSVKAIHPDGSGSLFHRINGLPDDKGITPTMKDWAHEVRLIGREATHDEDLVTKEEVEDMQAFVELFLVYAFDLPSRIEARKAAHTTADQL